MKPTETRRALLVIPVILLALYLGSDPRRLLDTFDPAPLPALPVSTSNAATNTATKDNAAGNARLAQAFAAQESDVQVEITGKASRILSDDVDGSRHQRFILTLENGITVLVAHNIDLAPRVEGLRQGDMVQVYGEYEYNNQGGVMHWTHHDPAGRHEAGWIKLGAELYQ